MKNDLSPPDTAIEFLRRGLWPVPIHPRGVEIRTKEGVKIAEGKEPIGTAWGVKRPTVRSLRATFAANPGAGVGVRLGPEAGVIDIEVDGPEGEQSYRKIMRGDPPTVGWCSTRGPHNLFKYDPRLEKYGRTVIKVPELPGLEIRIGGDGKQLQSCCPPTTGTDGQPRRWNDCDQIVELPESVFVYLDEYLLKPRQPEACAPKPRDPGFVATAQDGASPEVRARAYVFSPGFPDSVSGQHGHDALYRCACELVDGFGLDRNQALPILREWNQAKARPPESEKQLTHKLNDTIKNHPQPSLRRLNADRSGGSTRPALAASSRNGSATGTTDPASLSALADADLGLTLANDIQAAPVRWLWLYRLACGAMALLAGDGGIGKSLVLLWIAARVSQGDPWGDGSGNAPIGDVIILSAEDRPEDTIVPRLMAMGADLSRITIMRARVVIRPEGKEPIVSPMTFQDRPYWREVFSRRPGCTLFIVAPLASYLGRGVSDAKNNEVRGVLEPFLTEIIEPRGVCMLCNSHLNKSIDARSPIHRILGSIAFAALPRNVHIVVRDTENEARRIFAQAKCNNAPDDLPALAYMVERREVVTDGGEVVETAVPIFAAEPVKIRLADLMAPRRDRGANRSEIDRATEWLKTKLEDGPVGSILCAKLGDLSLGRRWPDRKLPTQERRKLVLGRTKWWRETILKGRLGGESKRAGYNGPYLFRLPAHQWPPDPAAAVEASRVDKEEMASTDTTDTTDTTEEGACILYIGSVNAVEAMEAVEAVEAIPSEPASLASTGFEEGEIS
jgi:hypothetical protein